jgi:hypothetical protein
MRQSKIFHLKLPSDLSGLLSYFMVNCVPGCCGLDAYDFDPIYASHAIAKGGRVWVEHGLAKLQQLKSAIDALPADWRVDCDEMNSSWSKKEAQDFWGMLAGDIKQGLEIGAVQPDEPHPRHDPNQRFTR